MSLADLKVILTGRGVMRNTAERSSVRSRRSVRIKDWDYASPGFYFVTICIRNRECLFGSIFSGILKLSDLGLIANHELQHLPDHYHHVAVDRSIVMPNHLHAVIVIDGAHQFSPDIVWQNRTVPHEPLRRPTPGSLSAIIRSYKAGVTRIARTQGLGLKWQSGFYEHIIRSDASLNAIRDYIEANPSNWESDSENPMICELP
jgi:putative transposase